MEAIRERDNSFGLYRNDFFSDANFEKENRTVVCLHFINQVREAFIFSSVSKNSNRY